MDYRQTTHRALAGPLASGWAFAALVICSASVCAQTPQQAAPPPPSASHQAAAPLRTPAQEDMREFRLRIRDYARFVAQHPRIKNLSEEQREKLIEFVAGNMPDLKKCRMPRVPFSYSWCPPARASHQNTSSASFGPQNSNQSP
jgi:hypothetical protein